MMTVAVPEGENTPDVFLLDSRELPWDGSQGATLVRECNRRRELFPI